MSPRPGIIKGIKDEIGNWDFRKIWEIIAEKLWCPKVKAGVVQFVCSWDTYQKMSLRKQDLSYGILPASTLFHT